MPLTSSLYLNREYRTIKVKLCSTFSGVKQIYLNKILPPKKPKTKKQHWIAELNKILDE